jgi:phosphoribosylformimino-5-aminoimidazole carboxamide ribotide isomerase
VLKRYHADSDAASGFDILAAIDLRGGRVVRLEQGDFDRETSFADDPVAVAQSFVDQGARWLHVVDLDGARSGTPAHADVIGAIVAAVGERVAVEVAGGLRSSEAVDAVLAHGARRVVVGTAALRDPGFAGRLVERHGSAAIAVALDVRQGLAVGQGWVPGSGGVPVEPALDALAAVGVETFEVTAIDRDGVLAGPDLDLYRRLVARGRGAIIASAGIASTADLAAIRELGCRGAIIGRALYDGRLSLEAALSA